MRLNDAIVNETPKFMTEMPTEKDHAIVVTDPDSTDQLIIPLAVRGVTLTFLARKPTQREMKQLERLLGISHCVSLCRIRLVLLDCY
jgi:hypothetical protein